jgi:proteic killer suppression protein
MPAYRQPTVRNLLVTLDVINAVRYHAEVVRSFRDRDTERLFRRETPRRIPRAVWRSAMRRLLILDAAERLGDLRTPPGNRLEKLAGKRRGQHSIRINDQWRICFRWSSGDAEDVEVTDYH